MVRIWRCRDSNVALDGSCIVFSIQFRNAAAENDFGGGNELRHRWQALP